MPAPGPTKTPSPTVDIIIEMAGKIVLVERRFPPHGWALPGGFVDYGETVEQAAAREAMEETSLQLDGLRQFRVYSDPHRDPRRHTISTVFTARGRGVPQAADDARALVLADPRQLPEPMAFDHRRIIADYLQARGAGFPAGTPGAGAGSEKLNASGAPEGELLYNGPARE